MRKEVPQNWRILLQREMPMLKGEIIQSVYCGKTYARESGIDVIGSVRTQGRAAITQPLTQGNLCYHYGPNPLGNRPVIIIIDDEWVSNVM